MALPGRAHEVVGMPPEASRSIKNGGRVPMVVTRSVVGALGVLAASLAVASDGPAPLGEAAGRMTLPEGFRATLFAGEPDVRQPIAFAIDRRGRLWVAENYTYPGWRDKVERDEDRILIFEDADGDGRFDRRSVFWARRRANISGLTLGFGGVWVCASPELLFIPDRDGDDVPDGPPAAVLDGWSDNAKHNLFNALTWGPDGWLYGCNGISSPSLVGTPGTPDDRRVPINCGVWRFHPTRRTFETVINGSTNPWGLDFDDLGEAFITNCVIPHLFHVIPGAHFVRMYGTDFDPHLYTLMESCADHLHWAGGRWQDSRGGLGKHGEAGGGHAHAGAMIYLGDNWPDRYRDTIFMSNWHGHRINHDTLHPRGSGYVARHDRDFLMANDDWFRGLELKYGPDGGVFLTDWSDTGECHENDDDGAHRENGRIYKITYGQTKPVAVDLAKLGDLELAALQMHKNDWYVRHARLILQERAAEGRDLGPVHRALWAMFRDRPEVPRKLRALWALHVTGGLNEDALIEQLGHPSEHVRSWAIRLLGDAGGAPPRAVERFAAMAKSDPSPKVRLSLASALQRLPSPRRWAVAEALAAHGEDADDPNLPLMDWYAVAPLVPADVRRAVDLATRCAIPLVRRSIAHRAVLVDAPGADRPSPGLIALIDRIGQVRDPAARHDLLLGVHDALRGRTGVAMPEGWRALYGKLARDDDPEVGRLASLVALVFGDPEAVTALRGVMMDPSSRPEARDDAIRALVEARAPGLAPQLRTLLDDPAMRRPALRALAAFDDDATPRAILDRYASLDEPARGDAINTLASRPSYAMALLDAIGKGIVPRRDLSATVARQLKALRDPRVNAALERAWGTIRPTSKQKDTLIARYKAILTPGRLRSADPSAGRAVYDRSCVQCHRLFDSGGDVGPELTGSDRANLDYILENVLDPGASVGRDYRLTTVATRDGRLISGIVRERTDDTLTIQTVNERIVLDRSVVEESRESTDSMMPEGLFDKLSDDEVRDLVAYLAAPAQVPAPKADAGAPKAGADARTPSGR
jgi:putative membrane-bound dehydrogenase-like protein